MSQHTAEYLHQNILRGNVAKYGPAWWFDPAIENPADPSHFAGPVPLDVALPKMDVPFLETPIAAVLPNGQQIVSKEQKAIVNPRNNEIMGIQLKNWPLHGYWQWLFSNTRAVAGELKLNSCGLLNFGELAFAQFTLPESQVIAGLHVYPFIFASTRVGKSMATRWQVNTGIIECDNTLSGALGENSPMVKVRHSRKSLGQIQTVRDALGILYKTAEDLETVIDQLAHTPVSDSQWSRFVELHFPLEADAPKNTVTRVGNKRASLTELWHSDPRVTPWTGTGLGVLQATNTFNNHVVEVRGDHRAARNLMKTAAGAWDGEDSLILSELDKVLVRV